MKKIELPSLVVGNNPVATELNFDEFKASCERMSQEQEVTVNAAQLWIRMGNQRNPLCESGDRLALSSTPDESLIGRSGMSPRIHALGLVTLTQTWHGSLVSYQEYLRSIDRAWPTGEIGPVMPQNIPISIELPRHFGVKGLVAATYAVNDYFSQRS